MREADIIRRWALQRILGKKYFVPLSHAQRALLTDVGGQACHERAQRHQRRWHLRLVQRGPGHWSLVTGHWSPVTSPSVCVSNWRSPVPCAAYSLSLLSYLLVSNIRLVLCWGKFRQIIGVHFGPTGAFQWSEFQRLPQSRVEQAGRIKITSSFAVCVYGTEFAICTLGVRWQTAFHGAPQLDRRDLAVLNGGSGCDCFKFGSVLPNIGFKIVLLLGDLQLLFIAL